MTSPTTGLSGRLHRFRRWILLACVVAWAGALTATHIPAPSMPQLGVGDSNLHFVGFFGLAGAFWLTLAAYGRRTPARVLLLLLVMPAYAAFDELTQPYFQRTADIQDWKWDVIGTAVALLCAEIAMILSARRARRAGIACRP